MGLVDSALNTRQSIVRFAGVVMSAMVFPSGCSNFGKLSEGGAEMAQTPIADNHTGKTYPGRVV